MPGGGDSGGGDGYGGGVAAAATAAVVVPGATTVLSHASSFYDSSPSSGSGSCSPRLHPDFGGPLLSHKRHQHHVETGKFFFSIPMMNCLFFCGELFIP